MCTHTHTIMPCNKSLHLRTAAYRRHCTKSVNEPSKFGHSQEDATMINCIVSTFRGDFLLNQSICFDWTRLKYRGSISDWFMTDDFNCMHGQVFLTFNIKSVLANSWLTAVFPVSLASLLVSRQMKSIYCSTGDRK